MKITKSQLKQIIKEELREALGESYRQHRGGVYGTGDSPSMETEGPSGDAGLQLAQALEQKLEASDMSTGWAWDSISAEVMAPQTYPMDELRDLYNQELKNNMLPSLEEMGL